MPQTASTTVVNLVVESAGGAIPALGDPAVIQAAKDAFTEGARWSAAAAAVFLLLGFISTFRLTKRQHGE
jgi:hypothetical protein